MKVLITGASRGLGFSLAEKFSSEGHQVFAGVRKEQSAEKLKKLAAGLENLSVLEMDVSSWESIRNCADQIKGEINSLDLLINNAGVLFEEDKITRLMEVNPSVLRITMAVNTEGPILVTKAFYPLLKESRNPKIYTVTSESSMENSWYGMPVYSLSKVAAGKAMGILKSSVGENWQVLAVHPGRMDTDMGHQTAEISPETAAAGIYRMASGELEPKGWYVDYRGEKMEA